MREILYSRLTFKQAMVINIWAILLWGFYMLLLMGLVNWDVIELSIKVFCVILGGLIYGAALIKWYQSIYINK